jgi:HAD superfamily hydrolase (TIGR01509 family)
LKNCLIFDLDGTLVDSETYCLQALTDVVPDLKFTTLELSHRYRGKKLADILRDIETFVDRPLGSEIEAKYRERSTELIEGKASLYPNVGDALKCIQMPMCIASGGPLSKIRMLVDQNGLAPFFGENLFSSYDINSWKPSPNLFLHAAQAMRAEPDLCIVIEDSEVGIAAACAAGMTPIHFCEPGTDPLAEHIFRDFSDLPTLLESIRAD